jgi:pimeloyl-ACP methyl ester carboxylesterase
VRQRIWESSIWSVSNDRRRFVPTTVIDGIATRYEVTGSGPPLLMFSPGGFNATLDNWSSLGIYRRLDLLGRLAENYTCVAFDRRESGLSGGRVERVGWADYALQGRGLLDHLGFERAHLLGGCVGCSVALAFAVSYPERTSSMVLFSPAGGPKYRIKQHDRFTRHLGYVAEYGMQAVADLAARTTEDFSRDARVGPWVTVNRTDAEFATAFAAKDPDRYTLLAGSMARLLFDRDTVPGAEPEDLLLLGVPALVVPGQDDSHAPSAARYLQECLRLAQYWDVPVSDQTQATVLPRLTAFLSEMQ